MSVFLSEGSIAMEIDRLEGRFAGIRVLIVEDSEIHRRLTKQLVELVGCTADAVANGEQAIEAYRGQPYDLILMDCRMPSVNGYVATRTIRRLERTTGRRIPIVALTTCSSQMDLARCMNAGMDDFILKPLRREMLERTLQWFHLGTPPRREAC